MKDELGGKIMTGFEAHTPNTCSYLIDNGNSEQKAKEQKSV